MSPCSFVLEKPVPFDIRNFSRLATEISYVEWKLEVHRPVDKSLPLTLEFL